MSFQYSSSVLNQPIALRGRCHDMNIKDFRKLRGAKAVPIELDEPDEVDQAEAWDLEQEYMLDMHDYYVPSTWEDALDAEYERQYGPEHDLWMEDDTDYGYISYMNPELS